MNCFQIFYLCSSNTTSRAAIKCFIPLWIAFRFFIFVLQTQLSTRLSPAWEVVNCFQIFYLCSSNTTPQHRLDRKARLWIAFRFFIFVLQTQRWYALAYMHLCCELLSDFLSLFFKHNYHVVDVVICFVVNCFQIFYLCSSNTTISINNRCGGLLWIAFRFFIFVLQTQHTP